jgi:hypothetical protein
MTKMAFSAGGDGVSADCLSSKRPDGTPLGGGRADLVQKLLVESEWRMSQRRDDFCS